MRIAAGLAADLIASDVRYFELGARIESISGARLAWMPGLTDVMAGCVVLGAEVWRDRSTADSALVAVERRVAGLGGARVRLYLEPSETALAEALVERGYTSREETGFILEGPLEVAALVSLHRIGTEAGWEIKRALHRESPDGVDGHPTAPERWVELERQKAGSGVFTPWLIQVEDRVAGTAGTIERGPLLRLKNLLVHRDLRRRGAATAAVAAFGAMAQKSGRTLGLFAVKDSPSASVYRGCRMTPVTRWVEWLGPPIGAR